MVRARPRIFARVGRPMICNAIATMSTSIGCSDKTDPRKMVVKWSSRSLCQCRVLTSSFKCSSKGAKWHVVGIARSSSMGLSVGPGFDGEFRAGGATLWSIEYWVFESLALLATDPACRGMVPKSTFESIVVKSVKEGASLCCQKRQSRWAGSTAIILKRGGTMSPG